MDKLKNRIEQGFHSFPNIKIIHKLKTNDLSTFVYLFCDSLKIFNKEFHQLLKSKVKCTFQSIQVFMVSNNSYGLIIKFSKYSSSKLCQKVFQNYNWKFENTWINCVFIQNDPFDSSPLDFKEQILVQNVHSNMFQKTYVSITNKEIQLWFEELYYQKLQKKLNIKKKKQERDNDNKMNNNNNPKNQTESTNTTTKDSKFVDNFGLSPNDFSLFSTTIEMQNMIVCNSHTGKKTLLITPFTKFRRNIYKETIKHKWPITQLFVNKTNINLIFQPN